MYGDFASCLLLYCITIINIVCIAYPGWKCGAIYDDTCLRMSNTMPAVLGVFATGGILLLCAALVYTFHLCTRNAVCQFGATILAWIGALLNLGALLFYFKSVQPLWSQNLSLISLGMSLAIAGVLLRGMFTDNY